VEKRNQLQAQFDEDMAGAEQKTEELLEIAADESYVLEAFFFVLPRSLVHFHARLIPVTALPVEQTSQLA
jgi:hypothetical protein